MKKLSWVTGARIEYPPNLKIQEEARATVEFLTEPKSRNFGKKTLRSGKEVDDIRYFSRVKYIEGTARTKKGDADSVEAVSGDEYTLWFGTTLLTAVAEGSGWKEGGPTPSLKGTRWEIWRPNERIGGNRIYGAKHLSGKIGIITPDVETEPEVDEPEPEEIESKPEPSDMELDAVALQLSKAIEPLGELDTNTWYKYCDKKGFDGTQLTQRMIALDLVEVSGDVIKYKG